MLCQNGSHSSKSLKILKNLHVKITTLEENRVCAKKYSGNQVITTVCPFFRPFASCFCWKWVETIFMTKHAIVSPFWRKVFSRFETKWVQKYNHLSICAHKHEPKIVRFCVANFRIGVLVGTNWWWNFSEKFWLF